MAFALGRGDGTLIGDRNSDPASVPATGNYDRLLEFNLDFISLISDSPGRREREMPPQRKRPERWALCYNNAGNGKNFLDLNTMTYQIEILNPKAEKLLQDLADLKLISFSRTSNDPFMTVVKRLRKKAAAAKPPTLEEITKEVEIVRAKRYASKRKA